MVPCLAVLCAGLCWLHKAVYTGTDELELVVAVSGVGGVGYQITFLQKQSPTQLLILLSFGNLSGCLLWYRLLEFTTEFVACVAYCVHTVCIT